MVRIGILDDKLRSSFTALISKMGANEIEVCDCSMTDLFVATENSPMPKGEQYCRCLLVPGNMALEFSQRIRGKYAVSYGTALKDSISLSSIKKHKIGISVQREIITLSNEIVEPQEFIIERMENMEIKDILALASCFLVMGESKFKRIFGISRDKLA